MPGSCSGGLQTGQRDGRERPVSSRSVARDLFFAVVATPPQTPVQTLPLAENEYINAYDTDTWRETIRISHEQSADHISPDPQSLPSEPAPAPTRTTPSDASLASE
jgi:hypothetical protein